MLLAALEKRWSSFYAEAGVQGELNLQKIDTRYQTDDVLEKIPMVKSTSRFHLFPRLKLGYRADKVGELALSYVQRVIRPYGSYLNVFTDRSDATHVWKGNPDLKRRDDPFGRVVLFVCYFCFLVLTEPVLPE